MEFFISVLFVILIMLILGRNNASIIPSFSQPTPRPKHDDLDDHFLFSEHYTSDDSFYRSTLDDDYVFRSSTCTRHDDILTDPAYCHLPGNIFYPCHDDTSTSTSSWFDDWSLSSSSWDDWDSSFSSRDD